MTLHCAKFPLTAQIKKQKKRCKSVTYVQCRRLRSILSVNTATRKSSKALVQMLSNVNVAASLRRLRSGTNTDTDTSTNTSTNILQYWRIVFAFFCILMNFCFMFYIFLHPDLWTRNTYGKIQKTERKTKHYTLQTNTQLNTYKKENKRNKKPSTFFSIYICFYAMSLIPVTM